MPPSLQPYPVPNPDEPPPRGTSSQTTTGPLMNTACVPGQQPSWYSEPTAILTLNSTAVLRWDYAASNLGAVDDMTNTPPSSSDSTVNLAFVRQSPQGS